jgi:hypothetical protein
MTDSARIALLKAAESPLSDERISGGVHSVLKANEVANRVLKDVKLQKLMIDEISGVDRPANLLDGWMVVKRKPDAVLPDDLSQYPREVIQEAARLAISRSRGSLRIF